MLNLSRVAFKKRLCFLDSFSLSSYHSNKLSVLGTDITTRDWSIEEPNFSLEGSLINAHSLTRAACGMINQHSTLLHVMQNSSFLIEDHIFDIMRVSKHQEKKI